MSVLSLVHHKAMWAKNKRARTIGFWLLAVLVAAWIGVLLGAKPAHAATTFTVNATADARDANLANAACDVNTSISGNQCTLRAAIQEANDTTGADTIEFSIAGTGVKTISPKSPLPRITNSVTINGYTQPGARPNTLATGNNAVLKIVLDGTNAGTNANGLMIDDEARSSTIRGLVINRFRSAGVWISSGANKVQGNFIGTNAAGTADLGNGGGVWIQASNNTIGGTASGARNVISGNGGYGVALGWSAGNKILGNYIGTNAAGTADLGNGAGVLMKSFADNNTIGGAASGARNVISGNRGHGVALYDDGFGCCVDENKVLGNFIGTDKTGTKPLGNDGHGVVQEGVSNNTYKQNTIAFNGADGVLIRYESESTAMSARILSNSIFSNGELGIDLKNDGPTPNDPGDGDQGPNNLQNFPDITSAVTSSGSTTIAGTLNSKPNRTFTIQFFSNPAGNEGKKFLGEQSVSTDSEGNVTFTFVPDEAIRAGQKITATATGPKGTSEFSAPESVVAL